MRELVGSEPGVRELACKLASLPVSPPGQDPPVRYGDLPGKDAAYLRGWAKMLRQVDPDVILYHAEGRIHEYVENVDLDAALGQVSCPVLLLQGDPSRGGMVWDRDVEHALSLLPDGLHVRLEGAGHDLGLSAWDAVPLLRAMVNWLESL
jgi:pimeloyl-ACP methyl ester carboxylesterase